MTPNDAASLKVIGDIIAALGVPGALMVVLVWHLIRNKDKAPDTADAVLARLGKIEDLIDDLASTIRDTGSARDRQLDRIEGLIAPRYIHWTDRTIPPAGQP